MIELDSEALAVLHRVVGLDWSAIEPAILGTLFERSLDPSKRAQLGAHYTGKDDIVLIVEPVLMAPLRRRWAEVRAAATAIVARREAGPTGPETQRERERRIAQRARGDQELRDLLLAFLGELHAIRVLDPACGSGNFLYVALKQLLDLEKEVLLFMGDAGLTQPFPAVSPEQLHGIELNEYAHELAQITVWIGYIQWLRDNGFGLPAEPILRRLDNIHHMDAILSFSADGSPVEPTWPAADVIIGNPPFLGDKKMRGELGDAYVDKLRSLYEGRIRGGADLVTYWFERARALVAEGTVRRVGLLATNSIRNGANRRILERIKESGDLFMAWSDRPWVLNGAAVRVSMVGFDGGVETEKTLDGQPVAAINPDLTARQDVTRARKLPENAGLCFLGMMKGGPFDIEEATALAMLAAPLNPNGRPNTDVVRPRLGGQDITGRNRGGWVIDFVERDESDAALYEQPFEYVRRVVKPVRDQVRDSRMHTKWWLHGRSRPALRAALHGLRRCIVTPEVAKHRVFAWMPTDVIPDHKLHVIARDDDYFFGVLHSRVHELWSLAQCSWLGVGNDPSYSSTTTFETFPFPWRPGAEPQDDVRVTAIAEAALDLVVKRDLWLNPTGADEATRKKRTLTNLYNERPTWLDLAHRKLDRAVLDAYGWPHDLGDDAVLQRLLALNLQRAELFHPAPEAVEAADPG